METSPPESPNTEAVEQFTADAADISGAMAREKRIYSFGYPPDGSGPSRQAREEAKKRWEESKQRLLEISAVLFQTVGGEEACTVFQQALSGVGDMWGREELINNSAFLIEVLARSTKK